MLSIRLACTRAVIGLRISDAEGAMIARLTRRQSEREH